MDDMSLGETVRNIDQRLGRVEQFLPTLATRDELTATAATLATKDELAAAVATLATKDELAAAVAKLATKDELAAAVAKLATKEELAAAVERLATKEELREEGRQIRSEMRTLYESLHHDIRLVAEGLASMQHVVEEDTRSINAMLANHERRITTLESAPPPRRRRSGT